MTHYNCTGLIASTSSLPVQSLQDHTTLSFALCYLCVNLTTSVLFTLTPNQKMCNTFKRKIWRVSIPVILLVFCRYFRTFSYQNSHKLCKKNKYLSKNKEKWICPYKHMQSSPREHVLRKSLTQTQVNVWGSLWKMWATAGSYKNLNCTQLIFNLLEKRQIEWKYEGNLKKNYGASFSCMVCYDQSCY